MASASGGISLISLLGGLLEGTSTEALADTANRALKFAESDHRWVVDVRLKHDPKRAGDE